MTVKTDLLKNDRSVAIVDVEPRAFAVEKLEKKYNSAPSELAFQKVQSQSRRFRALQNDREVLLVFVGIP